jgi:hypothetical protein
MASACASARLAARTHCTNHRRMTVSTPSKYPFPSYVFLSTAQKILSGVLRLVPCSPPSFVSNLSILLVQFFNLNKIFFKSKWRSMSLQVRQVGSRRRRSTRLVPSSNTSEGRWFGCPDSGLLIANCVGSRGLQCSQRLPVWPMLSLTEHRAHFKGG